MTYGNTDFYMPLSLSRSGDQIFAYQGSEANPTMLFGINYDNEEWVPSSTSGNNSALPPSLNSTNSLVATGHSIIDDKLIVTEYDNGIYKGTTTGTPEDLMAEIVKVSNWELSDGSLDSTLPTSFNISPTGIRNLTLHGEPKSKNGLIVYLAFPSMAILLFSFIRLRQYKETKHN